MWSRANFYFFMQKWLEAKIETKVEVEGLVNKLKVSWLLQVISIIQS